MGVQAAVTTTLSGVDPQLEKPEGSTVRLMISGLFDLVSNATDVTDELQVNESETLPEPACDENLMKRGFAAQVTVTELGRADVK